MTLNRYRQKDYFCLSPSDASDLNLTGSPISYEYSSLNIKLEKCSDYQEVYNITCKTSAEIDNFFNDIQLNIMYVNSLLDFKDFTDPL